MWPEIGVAVLVWTLAAPFVSVVVGRGLRIAEQRDHRRQLGRVALPPTSVIPTPFPAADGSLMPALAQHHHTPVDR